LGETVHRPIVSAALVGPVDVSPGIYALVDSGSHHVLADAAMASFAGIDYSGSDRELNLGMGGSTIKVRFADVRMRLLAPGGTDDDFIEWETEVGFVNNWRPTFPMILGQRGFLDQFTVTMSNFARQTAVEAPSSFDERFGVPVQQSWWPHHRKEPGS